MSRYIATNRRDFIAWFRENVLPYVREQEQQYPDSRGRTLDVPMRREEWNNTIDHLVREGELPRRAEDWSAPW